MGHGAYDRWHDGQWTVFNRWDVDSLTNAGMFPFVLSFSCYTGNLEDQHGCIAEKFVNTDSIGAIAYFGASKGSRNPPDNRLCEAMFDAIFEDCLYQTGQIMVQGKLQMINLGIEDWCELYNLVGDPSLDLSGSTGNQYKPDLAVAHSAISFDPDPPSFGNPTIKAKVKNIGDGEVFPIDVDVAFYDGHPENGGLFIGYDNIQICSPGDSSDASVIWSTTMDDIGWHDIYVVVDPDNLIDEAFEGNNQSGVRVWLHNYQEGFPVYLSDIVESSPVLADLNNDDKKEIIVGSNSDSLYVLLFDGTPYPEWPNWLEDDVVSSPAVGDLNNDGSLEIVVGSGGLPGGTNRGKLWAFNTDGSLFWAEPIILGDAIISSPALGDIDGDDSLEIIIGTTLGGIPRISCKLYALKNDGTILWENPLGSIESTPALADLNCNGLPDVVITTSDTVYALEDSTGNLLWHVRVPAFVGRYPSPSLAELNGDDSIEVIVAGIAGISVLKGSNGDEIWSYATTTRAYSPTIGDIDRDGDLEIVFGTGKGESVSAKINVIDHNGDSVFSYPVDGTICSSPTIADIDGDTKMEIIFSFIGETTLFNYYGVYIINHDGTPFFQQCIPIYNGSKSSAAIGDIDDDGDVEIVLGGNDSQLHVWDFWGNPFHFEWTMFRYDHNHTGLYDAPPAAPTGLDYKIGVNSHVEVRLSWNANTEPDLAGYNVYRNDERINEDLVLTNSYRDRNVEPGKRYTYKVTAVDEGRKESDFSNEVTVFLPKYWIAAGSEEPSPWLVQRNGYYQWGSWQDSTADYHQEELIYHITDMNPAKLYEIGLIYFAPLDTNNQRIQILKADGIPIHVGIQIPHEPILIRRRIPRLAYRDGEICLDLKKIRGNNAVVSVAFIWEYETGGGSQSDGESTIPEVYALAQNYPNPTCGQTSILYQLPENTYVSLKIYNVVGQLTRTLVDEPMKAGYCRVNWDGRNESNDKVASGIYFYRIKTGSYIKTKKMVLVQ